MSRTLVIRQKRFTNPYKTVLTAAKRDGVDIPKAEAAYTRRRARSIMKKAPKKPQSRFGRIQPYKKRHKRTGRDFYWKKGAYSRPGHPPYWHTPGFNLRSIAFNPISPASVGIPHGRTSGGKATAYRVGPMGNRSKGRTPVPQLHEYGGTVKVRVRQRYYEDQGGNRFRRNFDKKGSMRYPARPYMRPAAAEARRSVKAKLGGSVPRLRNFGKMTPKRVWHRESGPKVRMVAL